MRPFFVSIGLLLCVQSVSAQVVTVGAKAGLNASTYIGPDNQNPRVGFTGGIIAAVAVTGPWSIQTELLYTRKGAQSPVTEMRLHYLEIPLLVRLNAGPIGSLHPVFLAGVAPAIELSCRGRTVEVVMPVSEGQSSGDPKPINCLQYRSEESDLGIVGGIGFETRSRGVTWTVEARYTEGVADINNSLFADRRQHNRSVTLLFGVKR